MRFSRTGIANPKGGNANPRPTLPTQGWGTRASIPFYSPVNYKSGILINDAGTNTKEWACVWATRQRFQKIRRLTRRYKEQVYAVMGAYLDESFDKKPEGIFAVGGIVGRGIPTFELDRKWEALLHRPDIEIEYFKASECEIGTGQFKKFVKRDRHPTPEERAHLQAISHEFISLITKESVVAQGIGVIQKDFYEVIQDSYAHSILGDDPFQLAYDLAIVQCAWIMKHTEKSLMADAKSWQKVERDFISFLRDDHEKYAPLAQQRYLNLRDKNPEAAKYMATHSIGDDKNIFILQAADAAVYEIRRALHIAHKQRNEPVRGQFNIFKSSSKMAIIQTANKQNLLNTVKLHKPGEPFDLTDIMEAEYSESIHFDI
jgi:hypothetical protein